MSFSFLVTAKGNGHAILLILQGMKVMSFQRRKIYDLLEADALTNVPIGVPFIVFELFMGT
ncbi:MAG: hypothetical protein U1E92_03875 [Moraxella osloensis]